MSYIHKVLTLPAVKAAGDILLQKTKAGVQMLAVGSSPALPAAGIVKEINVSGPKSVIFHESVQYVITNYDDSIVYTVVGTRCSVTLTADKIAFRCDDETLPIASFTVNGVEFKIVMIDVKPSSPVVIAPSDGNMRVYPYKIMAQTSAFSMNLPGSTGAHLSTDWEVSTDPDFNNIVFSRYNSTADKTSIMLPD
jgi:hypothetical protein